MSVDEISLVPTEKQNCPNDISTNSTKMHCLLIAIFVLLMYSHGSVAQAEYRYSIQDEMVSLNLSCAEYSSCKDKRWRDSLINFACHCGQFCVQLDTCCLDSPYISVPKPRVRPVCRSAYSGGTFFMMDSCPSSDSAWEGLCKEEWNGEDDIFKLVPVTSLQTSITYKNYFCFRCHESSEDFVHWTTRLESNAVDGNYYDASKERVALHYDGNEGTWIAVIGDGDSVSFPVNISIEAPYDIKPLVKNCKADLISSCSEHWTDKDVRGKCETYTAIKETVREGWTFKYRNFHCAVCNFERIDDIACFSPVYGGYGGYGGVKFSFTHLLDINRRDGDMVGDVQKCKEEYVWDPYTNNCRKLTCVIPGYSIQNGKCVAI